MNDSFETVFWREPHLVPEGLPSSRATHLAIGVFDGVHRGHQELLLRVTEASGVGGGLPAVLTFDPNPARLVRSDSYLGDLTTTTERVRLFASYGMEMAVVIHFSPRFASMSGNAFLLRILTLFPALRHVVVGFNFHLGYQREIRATELVQWMASRGVRVDIVSALKDNVDSISSSRIRRAVAAGDFGLVSAMLGREYAVAVDGSLPSHRDQCAQLLPAPGRYACTLVRAGASREGMMGVSSDGTLTWEPCCEDTQYVILRSTKHGING